GRPTHLQDFLCVLCGGSLRPLRLKALDRKGREENRSLNKSEARKGRWTSPTGFRFRNQASSDIPPNDGLERIDQVKLQTVQVRFDLPNLYACCFYGVLKVRIQSAPTVPGKARHGVAAQLPQGIDTVLQDVSRGALVAFSKRGEHRVLLLPQPCITNLNVVL